MMSMWRRPFFLMLLLSLLCSVPSVQAQEKYDQTWRHSTIAIPKISQAPKIDGHINEQEWSTATLFPALMSRDPLAGDGLPPKHRTWVWLSYTDDTLYWAFRQDLPSHELPVLARATKRDKGEGSDNTINILFSTNPSRYWQQFNISGNALSNLYDRRFDDGSANYWNPNITYKSRATETGYEGEMAIPFKDLDLNGAPADGTQWNCYFYSAWRKGGTRILSWPYVRWRRKGECGRIIFGGDIPAVRFEEDGKVELVGPTASTASVMTKLMHRPKRQGEAFYFPSVMAAVDNATGEGATFQSFDEIITGALTGFSQVNDTEKVGEYLLRYEINHGEKLLARGVQSAYVAPPLDLELTPMFLQVRQLKIVARTQKTEAAKVKLSVEPKLATATVGFVGGHAKHAFDSAKWPVGSYTVKAESLDASGKVMDKISVAFEKPKLPLWWTLKEGFDPMIPPPWHPIRATADWAEVLGRHYAMGEQALPTQITTRGETILASPIELRTSGGWNDVSSEMVSTAPDKTVYTAMMRKGNVQVQVRNQLEFDGFMLVDVTMTGSGQLDQLDLVIPFLTRHAQLMQNYYKAPGPGKRVGRFTGEIPDEGYKSPPFITTWIGTDRYGFEFSIESSRGWSMAKPAEAIIISRQGEVTEFRAQMVSRPITLEKDKPRRIRFGLVATPTKTITPSLRERRFYDDVNVALLPYDWAGFPAWHPPMTDEALIKSRRQWVQGFHDRGQKLLVNGGWAVSVQDKQNAPWINEMFAQPLTNVSYSGAKQYAYCYKSPYATFLANSFAYNARLLRYDGIRFDTVTPGYVCKSVDHDCAWTDDHGNQWPTYSFFSQREAWKRIYTALHGGVIDDGIVYTPNAAGPIMAVHSFSDHHEIGEGFYQHAPSLKAGYPPGMIRATMTGEAYGFVTASNLKFGPLFSNERIGALIVNNAEPRFHNSRRWQMGYTAHANPAASIWDAWDWVDRYQSRFHGWWENQDYVKVDKGENEVYASFWRRAGRTNRVLLCVTNYEKKALHQLPVQLYYASLGLQWPLHVQDALTGDNVPIERDGSMKLDVFGQRYRLLMISSEPTEYPEDRQGENLLTSAPAQLDSGWKSTPISLEPNSTYVISAMVKIDGFMGANSKNPNVMGRFSPAVRHYVSIALGGKGVHAIANSNRRHGPEAYYTTDLYRRQCWPQWWEPTGGWVRMFSPVRTSADAESGIFYVSITDKGEAVVKDIQVRKVN